MEEANQLEGYVDWKGRASLKGHHGGILAASFVLVVEVLENLAYLANASNLVLYLSQFMHLSPSSSANIVTNFMGTAFLLALLGGFLSDAFFTTYRIYLISAAIEVMGLLTLTIQAHMPTLKPPVCVLPNTYTPCPEIDGANKAILFTGLFLVALGVGGIKGSLPAHGAEQFDENTGDGRRLRSTFFNYYVFSLSCGALIAVTFVVWIEDNKGWQWGFGIASATILLSIPVFLLGTTLYRNKIPKGSPITTIFKVVAASLYNSCNSRSSSAAVINMAISMEEQEDISKGENPIQIKRTESFTFLDRAISNNPDPTHKFFECTPNQIEEVKRVVKTLPIFASTIILNSCLAQLSTFSVQQASTMNTELGSLKIPPASLPVFPVIFTIILAPLYTHIIIPFARRLTKTETGITHLQRIGTGLFLSVVGMAVAALVEMKRKRVATRFGLLNSSGPLPISVFWVGLQYLFLGSADLFTLAGLMEFFFSEAPISMRSLATSLSWASLATGYYFSSVLISMVNSVTGTFRHTPWLYGSNLNHYRLERFYWLMCVLSGLNFLHFVFWANRYKYRV